MPLTWLHALDPVAIHILGLPIRWYGLSYALGFLLGWLILRTLAKRGLAKIPTERTADMVITIAIGAVLGGRLGYVIFYQPSLITDIASAFPYWGVLRVNDGGMASHGGILGAIAGAYLVTRTLKKDDDAESPPFLHVVDLMAALAPVGLLLGRLANFVNGELLGRIVTQPADHQPAPWWAVKFPQEVFSGHDDAVVYTPEQAAQLDRMIELARVGNESDYYAYQRILDRIQSGDQTLAEQLAPLISARHPSQLYQAAAEGLILLIALWLIWARPRKPGVIGCWFLIVYGVGRITTEFWRLPDAHLQVERIAGLSRGQWLSAAMMIAGLAILPIVTRRDTPKLGGYLSPRVRGAMSASDPTKGGERTED